MQPISTAGQRFTQLPKSSVVRESTFSSLGCEKSSALLSDYTSIMYPYDLALIQLSRVLSAFHTSGHVDGLGGILGTATNQPTFIETSSVRSACSSCAKS